MNYINLKILHLEIIEQEWDLEDIQVIIHRMAIKMVWAVCIVVIVVWVE